MVDELRLDWYSGPPSPCLDALLLEQATRIADALERIAEVIEEWDEDRIVRDALGDSSE